MNASDLLTPWLMLTAALVPFVYVEKWIHSHLYGVGWLLTNDNKSATILYYILLFPGVLVHEVTQWLVAGAIGVETKAIRIWPEPQKDGTLRLDFVQLKEPNRFSAAIIGAAPSVIGIALVWVISNYILNLDMLLKALGSGDPATIGSAIQLLASKPDFYLWLYLLFAISNAMLPTPADRKGWPLILGLFAGVIVFLIVIGTGPQLLETYENTIIVGVERLTTAFVTVLVVELPAMMVLGFSEEILERTTSRKFQYAPPVVHSKRQPGSNEPLLPGEPKPSVYLLELPVPLPPDKPKPRRAAPPVRSTPPAAPPSPARTPSSTPSHAANTAQPTRRADSRAEEPTLRPETGHRPPADGPSAPTAGQRPTTPPHRTADQNERSRYTAPPTPDTEKTQFGNSGGTERIVRPGEPRRSSQPRRPSAPQRPAGQPAGSRPDTPTPQRPTDPDARFRRPSQPTPDSEKTQITGPRDTERTFRPGEPRRPSQSRGPSARPVGQRPSTPRRSERSAPDAKTPADDDRLNHYRSRRTSSPGPDRPGSAPRRPSRRPAPLVSSTQEAEIPDDNDDEIEYVPFDDVELPPDDDF